MMEKKKGAGNLSREFFEFVMPAVDIVERQGELVVSVDLPGFAKDSILLSVEGNMLSIRASRNEASEQGAVTTYQLHRPLRIDKTIPLPYTFTNDDAKLEGKAAYENGVVTLRLKLPTKSTIQIS